MVLAGHNLIIFALLIEETKGFNTNLRLVRRLDLRKLDEVYHFQHFTIPSTKFPKIEGMKKAIAEGTRIRVQTDSVAVLTQCFVPV